MLRTLRTTKGYGVHSPFAFDLITRVLTDDAAYYDFELIEEILTKYDRGNSRSKRYHQLLYKLVMKFRPCRLVKLGKLNRATEKIASLALKNIGEDTSNITMLLVGEGEKESFSIEKFENDEFVALLPDEGIDLEQCVKDLDYGMTFTSTAGTKVYAMLHHLPRTDYKLRF